MKTIQALQTWQRLIFFCFGVFFFNAATGEGIFGQSGNVRPAATTESIDSPPEPSPLTFSEVLRQVEENHPKLKSANAERRVSFAKFSEKQAAFDPMINANSDYLRYNSTSTPGKPRAAFQNEANVEMLTRSGIKFFGGTRLNLGGVKSPLSQTGTGGEWYGGMALPLMRDFRINPKIAAERQALIGMEIAETEFTAARLGLFVDAAESYWDWFAAQKRLEVNKNLLNIAQTRAGQIAERVRSGDLPPIDETEATQEVQRRLGNTIKAERDLQKSVYKLGLYLWTPAGTPDELPSGEKVPERLPMPILLMPTVIENGVRRALERRPEIANIELAADVSEVDAELAQNARRPNFDLYLAPGRDFGTDAIGTTMKFGVSYSFPVGRRAADAQLAAARLKLEKIGFEEQLIEQKIAVEVRDLANAVNTAYGRFLLAQRELELAAALERGERTRFELGDSTLFLVNQRERATAEAEIKIIDVRAEYELSLVNFRIATMEY